MAQAIFPGTGSTLTVHHVTGEDELNAALSLIQDDTVLGFDMEWVPSFTKGTVNPVSVVQLAGRAHILVLQLTRFEAFPTSIEAILKDERVIKVGVGITEDAIKLQHDHGVQIGRMCDLNKAFISVDPEPWKVILPPPGRNKRPRRAADDLVRFESPGLSRLVSRYLDLKLQKPQSIRLSDWAAPLTGAQVTYAANDALAGLLLYDVLQAFQQQINPSD